jgi:hypothetical protein
MNFPRINLPGIDASRINIQNYGRILAIGVAAVLGLVVLSAAGSGISGFVDSQMPESAPRNFMRGLATRNCTQMLDHVCGSFACPNLPNTAMEVRDQSYSVQSNDGKNATVLTYIDVRAKGRLGEIKIQLEVPLNVTKLGSRWCIQKTANLEGFLKSFIDSLLK